jgi:hypothetical protein
MPYLTCIGGHGAVGKNKGGAGSRGYWIFRRGRTVIVRYGAVQVERSTHVSIEWMREPREIRYPERSVAAARELIRKIVTEKTRLEHGYRQLGVGVKIC